MGSAAGGAGGGGGRPPDFGENMDFLIFVMINLTFCRFRPPAPQILGSSGPHATD